MARSTATDGPAFLKRTSPPARPPARQLQRNAQAVFMMAMSRFCAGSVSRGAAQLGAVRHTSSSRLVSSVNMNV
jgi:hypothetical protein